MEAIHKESCAVINAELGVIEARPKGVELCSSVQESLLEVAMVLCRVLENGERN